MTLEEIARILLAVLAGTTILFALAGTAYLFLGSQDIHDQSAKAALKNLADLINSQEGEQWNVETVIRLPSDEYVLAGFGENQQTSMFIYEKKCDGTCMCLYKELDDEMPNRIGCEDISQYNYFRSGGDFDSNNWNDFEYRNDIPQVCTHELFGRVTNQSSVLLVVETCN